MCEAKSSTVLPATAAGTITQTARGLASFVISSSIDVGAPNAATGNLFHRGRIHVIDHALVAILRQAPHQTGAHAS